MDTFVFTLQAFFLFLRPPFPPAIFPVAQSFPQIFLDTGLGRRERTKQKIPSLNRIRDAPLIVAPVNF